MQVVHLRYKHRCRVRKDPSARARQMHEKALVEFARRATTDSQNLVDTISMEDAIRRAYFNVDTGFRSIAKT